MTLDHSQQALLLVDDVEDNLVALEAALEPLGHRLVKARSGEEALRHLLKDDFAAVVLDVQGKIAWGRADIGGDPIVVVLGSAVSDAHLEGLRRDGVSYFFGGERTLDLSAVLQFLYQELGIRRLLIEGGGHVNGAFLRAGLIDEISLAVCPAVDGAQGAPSVFDSVADESGQRAPLTGMQLSSCEVLDGGAVWLRYRLENAAQP